MQVINPVKYGIKYSELAEEMKQYMNLKVSYNYNLPSYESITWHLLLRRWIKGLNVEE